MIFFELLFCKPLSELAVDDFLSVQQVNSFTLAGNHYTSHSGGSWIKYTSIHSPSLVSPAQVQAMFCVNKEIYLVLKSYAPLHSTPDGALVLPSESICLCGKWSP